MQYSLLGAGLLLFVAIVAMAYYQQLQAYKEYLSDERITQD